jgi:uncharacterized membrane protein YgcG
MTTTTVRLGYVALCTVLAFVLGATARAQEKTPMPPFTGERVIVKDVPDRYGALADQIARLEKASTQTYYVVVVKSTGPGDSATRQYSNQLFDSWRKHGSKRGRSFDPQRSVIVVVALDNHQVALKPGLKLDGLGLNPEVIQRDLINAEGGFIELARAGRFSDAISTLLDQTNNWIAERDSQTARVALAKPAAKTAESLPVPTSSASKVPAAAPESSAGQTPRTDRSVIQVEPEPKRQASSDWFLVLMLGIPILVLLAAFVGWIWVLFRRRHTQFAGRIKEIKSKAADLMDRLDGLKERLKLMPTSTEFKQPLTGETQALYNAVNERQGKLWDGWLHVMEVLDKAEKLAARSASPLSQKTLDEAQELINRQGSFEQIESQAKAIEADIDRLDQAHGVARAVLSTVTAARPKIDAGLENIKKLRLPTAPFEEEVSAIEAGITGAGTALVADPLATKTALEQLQSRMEKLIGRIERVVSLHADAGKVRASLEAIKRQAAGHRAQGLKLVEDGGNPDPILGQADEASAELLNSLAAGDPDAATQKLEAAKSLAQGAQATIEKVQKAKALCERDLPGRSRETERLRAALPQAESYQNDLERDFARSSWQAVGRNLDQVRSLLATFDKQSQQAAAAATTTKQEYIRGAGLVEELARQQQIVLRLMSGLGEQLNSLMNVRNECRKLNEDVAATERRADLVIRQNEAIISDVARNSLENARRTKADLAAQSNEARPDWPALRQRLLEVIEDLKISQSQAEEDVKNHEALAQEFEQVRNAAGRVYSFLASHEEDRLAANQHYQAAADALDRVGMEITEPRGRSGALLEQVRGAAADLNRAEELAREDIRLAAQAQAEIAEAGRAIDQARSYSTMGFGVDTSGCESQVFQAQQLLQNQNYEQSIKLAGAGMQQARQVYYTAMQHAYMRQMSMAAEQRRQAARMAAPPWNGVSFGAAAATAAAAAILERAGSEAQASPEAGDGSWSGDAGQGSW